MGTRKVIVELMLDVPDGVEVPTSEEISDDLNSALSDSDGIWRLCGCETWLNDVKDLTVVEPTPVCSEPIHEDAMCGTPCGEEPLGCAKCIEEQSQIASAQRNYEAGYAYACGYHD